MINAIAFDWTSAQPAIVIELSVNCSCGREVKRFLDVERVPDGRGWVFVFECSGCHMRAQRVFILGEAKITLADRSKLEDG